MLNPTQTTCSSVPLAQQILSLSTQTQTQSQSHTHTHTYTLTHTHTKLKYKNLPVRSQKAFPSPSHIRCWAHRLDLKLLGAVQYGLGLEPSLGRLCEVLLSYLLGYLFRRAPACVHRRVRRSSFTFLYMSVGLGLVDMNDVLFVLY